MAPSAQPSEESPVPNIWMTAGDDQARTASKAPREDSTIAIVSLAGMPIAAALLQRRGRSPPRPIRCHRC